MFGTLLLLVVFLSLSTVSFAVNTSFGERHNAADCGQNDCKVRKILNFSKDWDVHSWTTPFPRLTNDHPQGIHIPMSNPHATMSNDSPIKHVCAIVGTGSAARTHAKSLKKIKNVALVCFCGSDRERTGQIAKEFECTPETDYHRLLERPDITSIIFANEPKRHILAADAAHAGKNLLLEKPLATTLHEAQTIVDACQKNSIVAATVFQRRFGTDVAKIREIIAQRTIGKIQTVDVQVLINRNLAYYNHGNQWRMEPCGGIVLNRLIHNFDLLIHIFGTVRSVFAQLDYLNASCKVDIVATVVLEFVSGLRVTVRGASNLPKGLGEFWTLFGEKGWLRMHGQEIHWSNDPSTKSQSWKNRFNRLVSCAQRPPLYPHGILDNLLEDFFLSIQNDQSPKVTVQAGLAALEVALAAHESHLNQATVFLHQHGA